MALRHAGKFLNSRGLFLGLWICGSHVPYGRHGLHRSLLDRSAAPVSLLSQPVTKEIRGHD